MPPGCKCSSSLSVIVLVSTDLRDPKYAKSNEILVVQFYPIRVFLPHIAFINLANPKLQFLCCFVVHTHWQVAKTYQVED